MLSSNEMTSINTWMPFGSIVAIMVKPVIAVLPVAVNVAILYYGISVFLGVVPALVSEFVSY